MELETDVAEASAVFLDLGQVLDFQDDIADRDGGVLGEDVGDLAADHAGDQLLRVVIAGGAALDPLAVADDGDLVRYADYTEVETMPKNSSRDSTYKESQLKTSA